MVAFSKDSEGEARKLAHFARVDNNDTTTALAVAKWLTCKRNEIVENKPWIAFIDKFVSNMEGSYTFGCPVENKKLGVVIEIVKETTYGLRPGEDCSQLLVDRAQEEILKIGK